MKILVLGVTGMLGNALFRGFSHAADVEVIGTCRDAGGRALFPADQQDHILYGVDVDRFETVTKTVTEQSPDVVINAVGLVKQLQNAEDPLEAIPINSLLPHRLAALCRTIGARLVHVSTDCVFAGTRGNYLESDLPDATDLYGRSKLLGEVNAPHAITLRTSIIGHELRGGARSLVNWFLAQQGETKGYTKAVFSGLPTVELARVIKDFVLPNPHLHGLYHVASTPIDKYSLLKLVAETYNKDITITASDAVAIDRSLNADRFNAATGYVPPSWPELVRRMADFT